MRSFSGDGYIRRLCAGDEGIARELFTMMAEVFDGAGRSETLDFDHVRDLLTRGEFFAVAAIDRGVVVGGVTGHVLPMTRSRSSELFIYDLAVRVDCQRQGIGRALLTALREMAVAEGITTSFVATDNDDGHALSFYRAVGGEASPVTIFTFTDSTTSS